MVQHIKHYSRISGSVHLKRASAPCYLLHLKFHSFEQLEPLDSNCKDCLHSLLSFVVFVQQLVRHDKGLLHVSSDINAAHETCEQRSNNERF